MSSYPQSNCSFPILTTLFDINLELSQEKQNEYKSKVLEAVSRDARTKAEAIASGQGRNIGMLVSLTNNEFNYGGPVVYYAKSEASAENSMEVDRAALNIAPREMEVPKFP